MKIKTHLIYALFFLLMGMVPKGLKAQCTQYELTELFVPGDFEPCRSYALSKTLTYWFEAFQVPDPDNPGQMLSLEVDLNDGNGRVPVNPFQSITTTYSSSGTKLISVYACQNNGNCYIYKTFNVNIVNTYANYSSPDQVVTVSTTRTWDPTVHACSNPYPAGSPFLDADIGKAKAYIKYAPGQNAITKPIIFVDGFDLRTETKRVTDPAIGTGADGIIRYGATGWDVVVTGSSEGRIHTSSGYQSEFRMYPEAFSQLQSLGYDIIFFDFERGSDYIQKNAILLEEFLKQLNGDGTSPGLKEADPLTGLINGNVVVGASMGGMISRMALTSMEEDGLDHCTNTYLSFDAPQKGANIGLGIQAAAYLLKNYTDDPMLDQLDLDDLDFTKYAELWDDLNRPAARQMVVENFGEAYSSGKIKFKSWEENDVYPLDPSVDYACLRESFVSELEDLGYPQQARNLAIACGSQLGLSHDYDAGDLLYEGKVKLDINAPFFICDIEGDVVKLGMWAGSGGSCDYKLVIQDEGDLEDTEEYIRLIADDVLLAVGLPSVAAFSDFLEEEINVCPLDVVTAYAQVVQPIPAYDHSPGSYRYDLLGYNFETNLSEKIFLNYGYELNGEGGLVPNRERQTFMPTISALDINWEMNDVNLHRNVSQENIISNGLTPFDAFYAPDDNLKHVEIDQGMIDWIIEQMGTTGNNMQAALPAPQGSSYNFGNGQRNRIPSVLIEDTGILSVNALGNTGYGDEPESGTSHYVAYTADVCGSGSQIIIEDGGKMILGNHNSTGANNKATVYVTEGSSIEVRAGAKLRLARGSQLVIQKGASLTIEEGGRIDLWWYDSSIHVEEGGELIINGDFKFLGSGFFQFDKGNILTLNAEFNLDGSGSRFIQINKGADLDIAGGQLDLYNGTVKYADGASIKIGPGGEITSNYVDYESNSPGLNNYGISASGAAKIDLFNSDFIDLDNGLQMTQGSATGIYRTYLCNFTNCKVGVLTLDHSRFSSYITRYKGESQGIAAIIASFTDNIYITGSIIENYNTTGAGALTINDVPTVFVSGVSINNNKIGALLENVASFRLSDAHITNCDDYGILVPSGSFSSPNNLTNIEMFSTSSVENCPVGIQIHKGGIYEGDLFGRVLMNCAKLINNDVGIQGVDIPLEIDALDHCQCNDPNAANPNTFIKVKSPFFQSKYFNICYDDLQGVVNSVSARSNYWNDNLTPGVDYILRYTNSSGACKGINYIPLDASFAAGSEPLHCNNGPSDPNDPKDQKREGAIEDYSGELNLSVFPNPTRDYFTVSLPTPSFDVQVYNAVGQLIYQGTHDTSTQLNSNDWSDGLYLIKVKDNLSKKEYSQKLIVQRS